MRPYLTTQRGFLFSDDCLAVLANIRSESIDCVFADPPFNLGKDYKNGFEDRVSEGRYYDWCKQWIFECSRVLKPGGAFFLYALPELAVRFAGFLNERLSFRHWIALSMKGSYPRGKSSTRRITRFFITRVDNRQNSIRYACPSRRAATVTKNSRTTADIETN